MIFAFTILIVVSPLLLFIALLVRYNLGSPIFFRQSRPGLQGKTFNLIKFRTMRDITDKDGVLLADSFRITRLGKFLRATSLDELPEFWNVLKGEMSIVGPRPLLIEYLPLYNQHQNRRHEIRPGITGLTQINGRNDLAWMEKFYLDVWYVDNQSLWLDIKILLSTIKIVILCKGINSKGSVTTEKFTGG